MTGPEHYREAETCVRQGCASDEQGQLADAHIWLQLAQVHATLALAAVTAMGLDLHGPDWKAWHEVASAEAHAAEVTR